MPVPLLTSRNYTPSGQSSVLWEDSAGVILIALPRCGLRSVRGWLSSAGGVDRHWLTKHEAYIKSTQGAEVILTVRDPAVRMVSAWRGLWYKEMSLTTFVNRVTTHTDDELNIHVKSMMSFITLLNGNIIEPTQLIRLTHMEQDLGDWKARKGGHMRRGTYLGHRNRSMGPKALITPTIRAKARERFADDYSYFNLNITPPEPS